MTKRTALYQEHLKSGGKMVDFAGWEMPLHYGSQLEEHKQVRTAAGMFDVSHMTVVDVTGPDAHAYLRHLAANDVAKLTTAGTALYGVLLNEEAGIIDDLIIYRREKGYRAVVNAGTREKVLAWMLVQAGEYEVNIEEWVDSAMIAVQGPDAIRHFVAQTGICGIEELVPFSFLEHEDWLVARTGYTGESGIEAILPGNSGVALWRGLLERGVHPTGLGARDTLRLEAGLNLYGQDMDESKNPLESNLAWTISWKPETRNFIGRERLEVIRNQRKNDHSAKKLTGLVLEGRGVIRHDQRVLTEHGEGVVTSGIFSPTLGYSIALARIPKDAEGRCSVEIRNKQVAARIVRPPFVREGKQVFS